jgi:hypothetical protein
MIGLEGLQGHNQGRVVAMGSATSNGRQLALAVKGSNGNNPGQMASNHHQAWETHTLVQGKTQTVAVSSNGTSLQTGIRLHAVGGGALTPGSAVQGVLRASTSRLRSQSMHHGQHQTSHICHALRWCVPCSTSCQRLTAWYALLYG